MMLWACLHLAPFPPAMLWTCASPLFVSQTYTHFFPCSCTLRWTATFSSCVVTVSCCWAGGAQMRAADAPCTPCRPQAHDQAFIPAIPLPVRVRDLSSPARPLCSHVAAVSRSSHAVQCRRCHPLPLGQPRRGATAAEACLAGIGPAFGARRREHPRLHRLGGGGAGLALRRLHVPGGASEVSQDASAQLARTAALLVAPARAAADGAPPLPGAAWRTSRQHGPQPTAAAC